MAPFFFKIYPKIHSKTIEIPQKSFWRLFSIESFQQNYNSGKFIFSYAQIFFSFQQISHFLAHRRIVRDKKEYFSILKILDLIQHEFVCFPFHHLTFITIHKFVFSWAVADRHRQRCAEVTEFRNGGGCNNYAYLLALELNKLR